MNTTLPFCSMSRVLARRMKAFFSANSNYVKEEANPIKELITNALKAKGIDVEGKSDAELMEAYNQMSEFQQLLAARYPEQKGFTKEEYDSVEDDYLAKKARRLVKQGLS